MNQKTRFLTGIILLFITIIFSGCSQTEKHSQNPSKKTQLRRPPAAVERAWLARHKYDPERRLVVPKYNGARWGSILEYTEEENLVYRDWWVRDVKMQELSPEPSTQLTPFSQIKDGRAEESSETEDPTSSLTPENESDDSEMDLFSGDGAASTDGADPFAPVQEPIGDPFAPVGSPPAEDAFSPLPGGDPFAPLP
jgi:hypothetical protein